MRKKRPAAQLRCCGRPAQQRRRPAIRGGISHAPNALLLAVVVWLAMVGSCVASGISGAMVPLTLKRLGANPATASSIFLTDVVSMALLLGLATLLIR
jgi:Mg/Co/Ni transporter MgtE